MSSLEILLIVRNLARDMTILKNIEFEGSLEQLIGTNTNIVFRTNLGGKFKSNF